MTIEWLTGVFFKYDLEAIVIYVWDIVVKTKIFWETRGDKVWRKPKAAVCVSQIESFLKFSFALGSVSF